MRSLKNILIVWLGAVAAAVVSVFIARRVVPVYGDETNNEFSIVAAMSGQSFESKAENLREGRVLALFGGVELDLVGAAIGNGATIILHAVLGGIDVIVPPGWRVEAITNEMLGGIGNRTNPDGQDDDAPLLLIDATAVLGGIEIHVQDVA
ncbi:hypothetical protein MNBD_ACTINO01-1733 [hydrothermal vent metagenome]|uniref:Cell wall-active antibiotics response LiaF-like C-terminal domain-containing protein n=1 Tax=hydrothermal vent metagenome TaxID=652676 RepID=A0A3B0RWN1_9ZZZZ